jgi:hypothetical protein
VRICFAHAIQSIEEDRSLPRFSPVPNPVHFPPDHHQLPGGEYFPCVTPQPTTTSSDDSHSLCNGTHSCVSWFACRPADIQGVAKGKARNYVYWEVRVASMLPGPCWIVDADARQACIRAKQMTSTGSLEAVVTGLDDSYNILALARSNGWHCTLTCKCAYMHFTALDSGIGHRDMSQKITNSPFCLHRAWVRGWM